MKYRTDNEAPEVEQDLKELGELHDLIEFGQLSARYLARLAAIGCPVFAW